MEVVGLSEIMAIAAGDDHSLAVTRDGQLFAWGSNQFSALGDGTTVDQLRPVAISLTEVAAVAAGEAHSLALLRSGAVTHGFNMSQRGIECVISGVGAGTVNVEAPPQANLAPPGWYLLFILNSSRVPSAGRWIRLTP